MYYQLIIFIEESSFSDNLVPRRRLHAHEMAHKEVVALVLAEVLTHGVAHAGQDHQLEILARFYQCVGHLHGGCRVHVVVHLAHNEHQRAREQMGVVHIRVAAVSLIHRITHPQLVPPYLVHPVVVASARRVGSLVELRMEQYGGHGLLSAGRASEYSDARGIHARISFGSRLYPRHVVGQARILQVLVAHFLKLLRAERRRHAVNLHHDESQFGKRGHPPVV